MIRFFFCDWYSKDGHFEGGLLHTWIIITLWQTKWLTCNKSYKISSKWRKKTFKPYFFLSYIDDHDIKLLNSHTMHITYPLPHISRKIPSSTPLQENPESIPSCIISHITTNMTIMPLISNLFQGYIRHLPRVINGSIHIHYSQTLHMTWPPLNCCSVPVPAEVACLGVGSCNV